MVGILEIELDGLDHVAIRVADLERSAEWYSKVLGLKRYQLPEWGDFPLFLLAGKSGVALFPANLEDPKLPPLTKNIGMDHFAFHLSQENFKKAIQHYDALKLDYTIKDHHYFDSVYTEDPDGHTVELTSIKVNLKDFYK